MIATSSIPVLASPDEGAPLVTELVVGEGARVLDAREGWLRIVVPTHATRLDGRGYPGWARETGLIDVPNWRPNTKVVAPNEAGLPLGALLQRDGGKPRLPGGSEAILGPAALGYVDAPLKDSPVEVSRRLLGLPYRWGGTDSTASMDCSGLVFRVMGLLGVEVPRDSADQFDRAPYRSREHWRAARKDDLIFFGTNSVDHVGFYLGDGTYLSAHGSTGTAVRDVEADPYWGFARYR